MIERYDCPELSDIWKDYNKFSTYLEVELALLKAQEGHLIPEGTYEVFKEKAKIDVERIKEIEKVTKHDVIAFCTSITENVPKDISKFFHFGCTSSDIIDTATNLQIKKSLTLITNGVEKLLSALENCALKYRNTICMGRSHGMNAEPMSFGQKFLSFYAEIERRNGELLKFMQNELTAQFSGAVGNYTVLNAQVEQSAAQLLGLKVEPISTQIIPRDRIAKALSLTSMTASAIERLAIEIRHLHHSDIGEVFEGFSSGQKGSSIMPHKKNPISSENISGLARVIKSHFQVALENNLLWHERDISHSSSERMILPDNFGLLYYIVKRMTSTIENLVVDTSAIEKKVLEQFTYLSSYIMHEALKNKNTSREELYPIFQKASFQAKSKEEFFDLLTESKLLQDKDKSFYHLLNIEGLKKVFMKELDTLYNRVLSKSEKKTI